MVRFLFLLILMGVPSVASAAEAIVYSRLTDGYWQVWRMDGDGKNNAQLTTSAFDKRDPDWFNKGKQIGFRTGNGQLYVMDAAGTGEREVLEKYNSINDPHFAKSANNVVFVRFDPRFMDKSNLWKSDTGGDRAEMLTRGVELRYQPNFSPDEQKVVFVQADKKTKGHYLWVMNADGSSPRQLTAGGASFDATPTFSPDGKTVAFSSNRDGGDYEIYLVNVADGSLTRLTHSPGLDTHPSFSPDGKKIAFVSNRSGNQQIWVMGVDGKDLVQLTNGTGDAIDPVWM